MRWRRLWSDIDIYFEMKEPPQRYPSIGSHTAVFDKWDNFSVDENLKREIDEKGVCKCYSISEPFKGASITKK